MMAPDPSVFVIDDDHSSALLFRSSLFPALADYHINRMRLIRRCLARLLQRADVSSTAEHKTKVSLPFA